MYWSKCSVVSGEKEAKDKFLQFLIEALWDVTLFQTVKTTFQGGILVTFSGSSSGRIMVLILKN